ncbi:MAG: amidohydrolase family protein [Acidimicrobiales bacterium]
MVALFDAHAFVGRLPGIEVGSGTVEGLRASMARVGITSAVVASTTAWLSEPKRGNHDLLAAIADEPALLPCWVVVPEGCDELESPAEFLSSSMRHGVVAARAFPLDHDYSLVGPDMAGYLEVFAAARLPFLIDIIQTDWETIETLAARYPTLPIVVSLISYVAMRRVTGALGRHRNIYLATSEMSGHQALEWFVQKFGSSRLLFASGNPVRDPAESVVRLLWSELNDHDVEQIASQNLTALVAEIRR